MHELCLQEMLAMALAHRSDLGGADIAGTDFSNALLDRTQQIALCRYADGTNSVTGVDTRKSLGAHRHTCHTLSECRGMAATLPWCPAHPRAAPRHGDIGAWLCGQAAAAGGGSGSRARPTPRGRRWQTMTRKRSSSQCLSTGSDCSVPLPTLCFVSGILLRKVHNSSDKNVKFDAENKQHSLGCFRPSLSTLQIVFCLIFTVYRIPDATHVNCSIRAVLQMLNAVPQL